MSNGDAPDYLGAMYNNLERRSNIWGLGYDQRTKFVQSAGARDLRSRRRTTCWCGSAAPDSFDADFQKSLRVAVRASCARGDVKFGVLAKERCTGDPAKRTGNEYMYQELAHRRTSRT